MNRLDQKILNRLAKHGIVSEEFEALIGSDLALEMLRAQGMNIVLDRNVYKFQSALTPVDDTLFCIVDVETNGSKTAHHQIIEIGAVKDRKSVV